MVWLAWCNPNPSAFALCLWLAFLSDIFDGMAARRLGVATAGLRRLDSIADSLFYIGALAAVWHLHASALTSRLAGIGLLAGLELARYAYDFAKFRREASYHMWSSKLWGIALFLGFMSLLAWERDGWMVSAAVWLGVWADLEGLAISMTLPRWRHDVPTLWHARALASGIAAGEGERG